MISIIDYGSGNVTAYSNIYKKLNMAHKIVNTSSDLEDASKIILPGVGAFDQVMESLNDSGMRETLDALVLRKKVPILGVCVGMQIMACTSEEGQMQGLSWIKGSILEIDTKMLKHKPQLPHMGWNSIQTTNNNNNIFENIDKDNGFYFLHSYFFSCENNKEVTATVNYGKNIPCAVNSGNIYGFQFHPEKSHLNGITLLKNFANI